MEKNERKAHRRVKIQLSLKRFFNNLFENLTISRNILMIIGGVIIGILGGYGSVLFKWLIRMVQNISWGGWGNPIEFIPQFAWYWILIIPAVGGLLTGLIVHFFAPEAKGHGVPEVMEANLVRGGIIRTRVPIAKSLASAINIGTGGSVGREGPIAQIGSAVGSIFGQIVHLGREERTVLVACGAGAGIAGTFNAPIAGALFALEIILGDFTISYITPIVIASVMSTVVAHQYLPTTQAFHIPGYDLVSAWELIPYAILGVITAFAGVAFIKLLYKTEDIFDSIKLPLYVKPAIGGLLIGAIALQYPHVLGVGYEVINQVLVNNILWSTTAVLIVGKLVATSITLGAGGSGGIFAPSLFIGAMSGAFLGHWVHVLFPDITATAGAYALVGMAGVIGAATHAPLTAIIIIFELTDDYAIILPVMLTTVIAVILAMRLKRESIYSLKLVRKGIDLFKGTDINILRELPVKNSYRKTIETVWKDTNLNDLIKLMSSSSHMVYFVTKEDGDIAGYITIDDLRRLYPQSDMIGHVVIANDIMHSIDFIVEEGDSLATALEYFVESGAEELPVVTQGDHTEPVGTIWYQDVMEAYNRQVFQKDMASGVAQKLSSSIGRTHPLKVIPGYSILECPVPGFLMEKALKNSGLREQHGVDLVLVSKPDDENNQRKSIRPGPDYQFEEGDRLIIFGESENVQNFTKYTS